MRKKWKTDRGHESVFKDTRKPGRFENYKRRKSEEISLEYFASRIISNN